MTKEELRQIRLDLNKIGELYRKLDTKLFNLIMEYDSQTPNAAHLPNEADLPPATCKCGTTLVNGHCPHETHL